MKIGPRWVPPMALLLSLALLLVVVADIRRGFMGLGYLVSSPWAHLSPWHPFLLIIGLVALFTSYRLMKRVESGLDPLRLLFWARILPFAIGALLMFDLVLLYRGVAASRIAMTGSMGIKGEGIPATTPTALLPLEGLSFTLRPLASALNYLVAVWHAIFIGLLLAGLFSTALAGHLREIWPNRGRFGATLFGAALALPQPFCSCCASPIAASLYRRGAPLNLALSFLVASPMLNVTTLILALLLLPLNFSLLRIGAGLLLALPISYATSLLIERGLRYGEEAEGMEGRRSSGWITRLLNRYCSLFHFEQQLLESEVASPSGFLRAWWRMVVRIGRVVLPVFLVGGAFTTLVVQALSPEMGNSPVGVAIAALAGTLLMISTWTELPVAALLIQAGMTGPAAALLITLPAVSIPCLLIFGGSLGSFRAALLLATMVFLVGLLAGLLYL